MTLKVGAVLHEIEIAVRALHGSLPDQTFQLNPPPEHLGNSAHGHL